MTQKCVCKPLDFISRTCRAARCVARPHTETVLLTGGPFLTRLPLLAVTGYIVTLASSVFLYSNPRSEPAGRRCAPPCSPVPLLPAHSAACWQHHHLNYVNKLTPLSETFILKRLCWQLCLNRSTSFCRYEALRDFWESGSLLTRYLCFGENHKQLDIH